MKRTLLIILLTISRCGLLPAQTPERLLTLPTLDTTSAVSFINIPSGGFLITTRQSGVTGSGTTFILTDSAGYPLSASQMQENISSITRCSDGGYLMMANDFYNYVVILKTDSAFNIQWAKKMTPFIFSLSVNSKATFEHQGQYYLAASCPVSLLDTTQNPFITHAVIIFRFDAAGNLTKTRILKDPLRSSNRFNLYQPYLAGTPDGSLYLSLAMLEYWASGTCNRWPAVIKMDTALNVQWSFTYRASIFNSVSNLMSLRDGNVILSGQRGNNYPYCTYFTHFLFKIDTAGSILFARDYHHPFWAAEGTGNGIELHDSTLVYSGVYNDTVVGHSISFFDHIDASGNTIQSGGFNPDYSANQGGFIMAGEKNGYIPLLRKNSTDTLLLLGLDPFTMYANCHSIPNTTLDSNATTTRAIFPVDTINYAFAFIDTVYPALITVPTNFSDMTCLPTGSTDLGATRSPGVYPNPSTGIINILHLPEGMITLSLFDLRGKKILEKKWLHGSSEETLDLSNLTPGMYFIHVTGDQIPIVLKVIKN